MKTVHVMDTFLASCRIIVKTVRVRLILSINTEKTQHSPTFAEATLGRKLKHESRRHEISNMHMHICWRECPLFPLLPWPRVPFRLHHLDECFTMSGRVWEILCMSQLHFSFMQRWRTGSSAQIHDTPSPCCPVRAKFL